MVESARLKDIAEAAKVPRDSLGLIRRHLATHGLNSLSLAFEEDHPVWNHMVEEGEVRVPSFVEQTLLDGLKPYVAAIRYEALGRGLRWGLLRI